MAYETVYVSQQDDGKWQVYKSGNKINEAVDLPYQAAINTAKNLINTVGDGHGTIITDQNGEQSVYSAS